VAGRSGVPATGPRLLRLDAVRSLAAFFGVGGLLCWAAVVLPHDPSVDGAVVSAVAAAAVAASGALLLARRVPSWVLGTLVAGGSALIALLVRAGHGTAQAVGFAAFIVWVVVYSACFFHARTAAVKGVVGVGGISLGWAGSGAYWVPLLLAAAAAVTTALVVGDLVHRVRAAADTDPLTGLCTLAGMIRRGDPLLAAAARSGEPVAVLLVQIRGLGQVVESMGHAAGEELVNRAGAVLEPIGRADGAVGARVSGDRLACLLPAAALAACQARAGGGSDGTPPTLTDGAVWAAQETLRRIRGPHRLAGVDLQLEGHVGVVVVTRTADDLPALLRAGEVALTEAVRRDTPVLVHDARLGSRGAEALRVLAELRDAIPAGQLRVHYQVQVGAHSGRPASVEALVRWQHPRRGLLAPGAFVPIAEPTEVIIDLTRWVLDEALRQCAAWLAEGLRVPVSVNLSARLLGHGPLLGEVLGRLQEHGVPPELLTVEITETALVTHLEPAAVLLDALRGHGVRTSIDDFGTRPASRCWPTCPSTSSRSTASSSPRAAWTRARRPS